MVELLEYFEPSISLQPEFCTQLINAGMEKLKQYAPIFEINVSSSSYCQSVQSWLEETLNTAGDGEATIEPADGRVRPVGEPVTG